MDIKKKKKNFVRTVHRHVHFRIELSGKLVWDPPPQSCSNQWYNKPPSPKFPWVRLVALVNYNLPLSPSWLSSSNQQRRKTIQLKTISTSHTAGANQSPEVLLVKSGLSNGCPHLLLKYKNYVAVHEESYWSPHAVHRWSTRGKSRPFLVGRLRSTLGKLQTVVKE